MHADCREAARLRILHTLLSLGGMLVLLLPAIPAQAYEFEARARSYGQRSSLLVRPIGTGISFSRRRMTQILQLELWDLGGRRNGLSRFQAEPEKGTKIFFSSYLRLNHDFGSYANEQLLLDGRFEDAVDVIPEIESQLLELDLLYGFWGMEGLIDGTLDLYVGRHMEVQTLDWFSMDGVKARVHTGLPLAVEAFVGVRVREHSWGGSESMAPDGTSGALCEEYAEGALAGSGSWRPIDGLPVASNSLFSSEGGRCPQREAWMPTWGASIVAEGLGAIHGRLSYRRSQSKSVGVIGPEGRLNFEDLGLYPNEVGQTPTWGVNEERIAATLRAPFRLSAKGLIIPYAAARYSLLHGLFDEAHAGVQVRSSSNTIETEVFYSVPTFDGDSIFNVFSTEPYSDARTTWRHRGAHASWGTYARGWGRRYQSEDAASVGQSVYRYTGGMQAGLDYRVQSNHLLRFDGYHEGGYGGRRSLGTLASRWQWRPDTLFQTRLSLSHRAQEVQGSVHGYSGGAQMGTTYLINQGFSASLMFEQTTYSLDRHELGVYGMLDLAFQPETH